MRQINNKNLLHLYELHETKNSIYLVMDCLEGGELFTVIKSREKFN